MKQKGRNMGERRADALLDTTTGEVVSIMKPIIRTPYNASFLPKRYERNLGPSLTVPDQSLSISQIMERYANGLPINAPVKTAVWHGENEFYPDPKKIDLIDRQEMIEQNRQEILELKNKLRTSYAKRQLVQKAIDFQEPEKNDPLPGKTSKKEDIND